MTDYSSPVCPLCQITNPMNPNRLEKIGDDPNEYYCPEHGKINMKNPEFVKNEYRIKKKLEELSVLITKRKVIQNEN